LRVVKIFERVVPHVAIVVVVSTAAGKKEITHHHFLQLIAIAPGDGGAKPREEVWPCLLSGSPLSGGSIATLGDSGLAESGDSYKANND
jgi:hypothetical protein